MARIQNRGQYVEEEEAELLMEEEDARKRELKAFDETKAGVRGLVLAGVQTIPSIFNCKQFGFNDNTTPPPNHLQQLHIPIIDLEFVHGSSSNKHYPVEVVERVRDACGKWGFFQIINHGIPVRVLDNVIQGIREFHEQEEDVKKALYSRDNVNKRVLYQSNFDLYNAPSANWRDTLAWIIPSAEQEHEDELPTVCRQAFSAYMKEGKQLGQTLFELLSEALGLKPKHLLEDMECTESLLMLGHYYPPCPQPELTIGTTGHCDSDFLTIVLQDQIGGLQVLHQNHWVDVAPLHGALIVNIGDLLQLVSNDTFISANHRVLSKKEGPRISVASFFRGQVSAHKRYGPIAELISEATPPMYRQVDFKEYMDYYLGKGLDGTSALEPFKLS